MKERAGVRIGISWGLDSAKNAKVFLATITI